MAMKKIDATKYTGIDTAIIRDLAEILNDTNLTNIEVEQDGLRICVARQNTTSEQTVYAPVSSSTVVPSPVPTTVGSTKKRNQKMR
ncbi:acetyl-CoA carboxylase biotin carboxyl carrier protein [Bartonella sp. JB15]|nr:acetyl-CoA carboxylase biotin carboxyl carrier protein [Bartonella sp. JB15]